MSHYKRNIEFSQKLLVFILLFLSIFSLGACGKKGGGGGGPPSIAAPNCNNSALARMWNMGGGVTYNFNTDCSFTMNYVSSVGVPKACEITGTYSDGNAYSYTGQMSLHMANHTCDSSLIGTNHVFNYSINNNILTLTN